MLTSVYDVIVYAYFNMTRVRGQFWPYVLLLGLLSTFPTEKSISLMFDVMLVQILSVTIFDMLVLVFCQ